MKILALLFAVVIALLVAAPSVLAQGYKGNPGVLVGTPGVATPTPVPSATQGAVAVCTNPPGPIYPNPKDTCDTTTILSDFEYSQQNTNFCNWGEAVDDFNSIVEVLAADYDQVGPCGDIRYDNNYYSATSYSGKSGSSLSSYSVRIFEGGATNEAVIHHLADPAELSCAAESGSTINVGWFPDYFDSAGTGKYMLYDAVTDTALNGGVAVAGSGPNTPILFADNRSGTKSYYVNYVALNTTVTANITAGVQKTVTLASAPVAGNVEFNQYVLVCNGNAGNPAGCGADKEVVRVDNINNAGGTPTTMRATFANSHTCPCLIWSEVPYSSIAPLDGTGSTDFVDAAAYMPNVPFAGYNSFYPGTRLNNVADGQGNVAPQCTAGTPGTTPTLWAVWASPNPNPRPASWTGPAPTPAASPTVSPNVSVYLTASAQHTPDVYVCYAASCTSWTKVTATWSKAASGFDSNTQRWSTIAPTSGVGMKNLQQAMVWEVCQTGVAPPWPANNCTMPVVGTSSENERVSTGLPGDADNSQRRKAMCEPRAQQESRDATNSLYGVGYGSAWGIFLNNRIIGPVCNPGAGACGSASPTPGPTFTPNVLFPGESNACRRSQVASNVGQCSNFGFDITRFDDLGALTQGDLDNSNAGSQYLPSNTNDNNCTFQYAEMHWNDLQVGSGFRAMMHMGTGATVAQVRAIVAHGNAFIDFFDGFRYPSGNNTPNPATMNSAFYAIVNGPVVEDQLGLAQIIHPHETFDDVAASYQSRYNAYALYLIVKDDPRVDSATDGGHTLSSFRDITSGATSRAGAWCTQGCLDPIYFTPIGKPLTGQGSSVGPCGDTFTGCDWSVSSGDWDAVNGVWVRHFAHGEAIYCPGVAISGASGMVDCTTKTITLDGCLFQLLPSSTNAPLSVGSALGGYVDQTPTQTRQYNSVCQNTLDMGPVTTARNTGYIFMFSKS